MKYHCDKYNTIYIYIAHNIYIYIIYTIYIPFNNLCEPGIQCSSQDDSLFQALAASRIAREGLLLQTPKQEPEVSALFFSRTPPCSRCLRSAFLLLPSPKPQQTSARALALQWSDLMWIPLRSYGYHIPNGTLYDSMHGSTHNVGTDPAGDETTCRLGGETWKECYQRDGLPKGVT